MKKIIFIVLIQFFLSGLVFGQYIDNALRFSQNFYSGSARFSGMSGAFGSLGGDFSSLSINPAGLGVFSTSEFTYSQGINYNKISSNYLGNKTYDTDYNLNVNNIGLVSSFKLNDTDTRFVNINLGIGYNNLNDFNKNVRMEGTNNKNSIMNYFVNNANDNLWSEAYEGLAWDTYLLNQDTLTNEYWSQVTDEQAINPEKYSLLQRKVLQTEGNIGEYTFTVGANFAHKLYLGAGINIQRINYNEYSTHYEIEPNNTTILDFHSLEFKENTEIRGTGVNLKLGAIYKPVEYLKLGLAVHLPTFYNIEERFYNSMNSSFDNGDSYSYKSENSSYAYSLQTPIRAIGSIAFQLKKIGLFSIEYEYVDYSSIKLSKGEDGYMFYGENDIIKKSFNNVNNIRIGGETRFGPMYLRGGYAYYGNPTSLSDETVKTHRNSYSAGLGYRENHFFIDFAAIHTVYKDEIFLYLDNPDASNNTYERNRFIITCGLKF